MPGISNEQQLCDAFRKLDVDEVVNCVNIMTEKEIVRAFEKDFYAKSDELKSVNYRIYWGNEEIQYPGLGVYINTSNVESYFDNRIKTGNVTLRDFWFYRYAGNTCPCSESERQRRSSGRALVDYVKYLNKMSKS
jgi:hypothetical protein